MRITLLHTAEDKFGNEFFLSFIDKLFCQVI